MPYIDTETLHYPMSEYEIRLANPTWSPPVPFRPPSDRWQLVLSGAQPSYDPISQYLTEGPPEEVSEGGWYTTWTVNQYPPEIVAQNQEAANQHLIMMITQEAQRYLDQFAQTRRYENILSACTYALSTTPSFKAEGDYCVQLRDQMWVALYAMMGEVLAGTRPRPGGFLELFDELPHAQWPDETEPFMPEGYGVIVP